MENGPNEKEPVATPDSLGCNSPKSPTDEIRKPCFHTHIADGIVLGAMAKQGLDERLSILLNENKLVE